MSSRPFSMLDALAAFVDAGATEAEQFERVAELAAGAQARLLRLGEIALARNDPAMMDAVADQMEEWNEGLAEAWKDLGG